jgi:hypothetical protein
MKRTNIYLDEKQTASLDRWAEQEGIPRAELIRKLLDRVLANRDDNLISDLQAIDDSFGTFRDPEAPMRRRGGRERHLARAWHDAS